MSGNIRTENFQNKKSIYYIWNDDITLKRKHLHTYCTQASFSCSWPHSVSIPSSDISFASPRLFYIWRHVLNIGEKFVKCLALGSKLRLCPQSRDWGEIDGDHHVFSSSISNSYCAEIPYGPFYVFMGNEGSFNQVRPSPRFPFPGSV